MATRAGRRRKLSLQEEINKATECSPPPAPPTTRKRYTLRHKEIEENEPSVGKFVKFPQATPAGKKNAHPVTDKKSTRATGRRTATVLKEKNVDPNHDTAVEEEKVETTKVKPGRTTRRQKKDSADNVHENIVKEQVEINCVDRNTSLSPKVGKKSKRNKRKAVENCSLGENDCDAMMKTAQDENTSDKLSDGDKNMKRLKQKGKGKKYIKTETINIPEVTFELISDTNKTVGSFIKTSSPSSVKVNLAEDASANTSAESFHSAAGSPTPSIHADNTLIPNNPDRSDLSSQPLDTTFDKNSLDSTITLSENEGKLSNNGTPGNKTSTPSITPESKQYGSSKKNSSKQSISNGEKTSTTSNSFLQKSLSEVNLSAKASGENEIALDTTYDKSPETRSARISKEILKGKVSEDIFDTTVVLVDSSVDTTRSSFASSKRSDIIPPPGKKTVSSSPLIKLKSDTTPNSTDKCDTDNVDGLTLDTPKLIREGTFTKDNTEELKEPSEVIQSFKESGEGVKTPIKVRTSIPAPGSTPYHACGKKTRSIERSTSVLNLTRSIEKDRSVLRRSSCVASVRQTRVVFCSPVCNAVRDTDRKSKIIKSSLKGSNKSFVYEELSPLPHSSRKRSYTQGDALDVQAKRKKLAGDELASSANRLSRPNAAKPAKCAPTTPSRTKAPSPRLSRSESKPTSVRSKLPNFAALHRRQFDKMESLSDCQERKAQRARQMLQFPPTGLYTLDGRKSPRVAAAPVPKPATEKPKETKPDPPAKTNNTYTRFGFKLATDINPFSIPSTRTVKPNVSANDKVNASKQAQKPNGVTAIRKVNASFPLRREKSKQTIMREKSSTVVAEKRKKETRDIIKGVRTNRRFELQMKSRNVS